MKRKLIIHVGMGKTGSSSIQKTLRESRHTLESSGIKYLGLMLEHLNLPQEFSWHKVNGWSDYINSDHALANQQLEAAFAYADSQLPESISTLVWSNEALFDRLNDVRPALDALSGRFDIKIVGYIRRPDSWISSAYLQWGVKHKSYTGPLKPFRAWSQTKPYVVSVKVEGWLGLSDNAKFFNFDNIHDVGSHFVESVLGRKASNIPVLRENDTPTPAVLSLFAYYNSLSEEEVLPSRLEPMLEKAGLNKALQPVPAYNNILPSESDIVRYVESQSEEICRVNEILKKLEEPEFDLSSIKFKDYSSRPVDFNRMLLKLVVFLYDELESVKQRLDGKG